MMNSWLDFHQSSEEYASNAALALRHGNRVEALELYAKAAEAERSALKYVDPNKRRTQAITAVSAASLLYKANLLHEAESLALEWLLNPQLLEFAAHDLRNILTSVWSERARHVTGLQFAPGEVVVSVRGGEVVEGGAPLDLIVDKVQVIQSLFYRTAEFLRGLPHRKRGPAPRAIQETCRPWLFQAAPGSYQFAVAIQEPKQTDMFGLPGPTASEVADKFMRILKAGSESPDGQLRELVPSNEYRSTFLALTRNLAPTGKMFDSLEVTSPKGLDSVRLDPTTRTHVSAVLRDDLVHKTPSLRRRQLHGVLRAVHLDKDWIEVTVEGEHIRISSVSETVDDLIGPMVNKMVTVHVMVDDQDKMTFLDIESAV